MTNFKLGRWLLVALAIVGLAFAAPVVSAHGTDTAADDAPTDNATADDWAAWMATADDWAAWMATADDWAAWMEAQMTEHMGPGSVEWMESHMGVTVDEMAQDMAGEEYHNGANDDYNGGMYGQGHC
ncbi:hypothetical protein [Haloarchaeobius sp. HRN-SO-5]|uniref:hypothetical protein n=1 Tax=Haloarchaeobius sp. HRN-SO-5 TaxID=3446118 RepID=UPI003EB92B1D